MPMTLQGGPFIAPNVGLHRITVKQYHKMIADGVFAEDERIELIEGYLVEKAVHDPIHDGTISLVFEEVMRIVPSGWIHRIQSSITLSTSEPEPDFILARGSIRTFLKRHPGPADLGLVVEVANSSLEFDRADKLRVYARAGIPTYWIINVIDGQVEVFERPSGADYASSAVYRKGDSVPLTLDGVVVGSIPADDLLP